MVKCDVIQDLIPLYFDEVASEASREMVDEHINECHACRYIWDKMKENDKSASVDMAGFEINALRKMRIKIAIKTLLVSFSAVTFILVIIWVVFRWSVPTPYDAKNIKVHPVKIQYIDGEEVVSESLMVLDIHNNYKGITIMQINDEIFISAINTIYTRFFRKEGTGTWVIMGGTDSIKGLKLMAPVIPRKTQTYIFTDREARHMYIYDHELDATLFDVTFFVILIS